jgi:hypothetical protein
MTHNNRINIKATESRKRRGMDTKEEDTQTSNRGGEIKRAHRGMISIGINSLI